jgi:hypothetical protein
MVSDVPSPQWDKGKNRQKKRRRTVFAIGLAVIFILLPALSVLVIALLLNIWN